MDFDKALRCFEENLRLFSDPATTPEKHNLYAGLANLAAGLRNLEAQVSYLIQLLPRQ